MNIDKMLVETVGITPMIIHNGRTANPLDPYAKKMKSLTSKRNKTEEDIEALLLVQWEAALYWNDEMGLYMPSENLYAAFFKAAKKHKLGPKCSAIAFPDPLGYPIITKNSKNLQLLTKDPENKFIKTVVVQRAKTISCRPIFNSWALNFELEFETATIDANEIKTILCCMAQRIGLGVWTGGSPKPGTYGKFIIKSLKWINTKTKETKTIEILESK